MSPGCHSAATAQGDTGAASPPTEAEHCARPSGRAQCFLGPCRPALAPPYTGDVALTPTTGWGVLHLFCRLAPDFDADALRKAMSAAEADGYQVIPVALLGHKADLGLMALGPDVWRLRQFQTEVCAAGLVPAQSYVSLTEISEYAAGIPDDMRQARLFPQLPPEGKAAFCFYPMSKRRGEVQNWYALDFEARKELMMGHGKVRAGPSTAGCSRSSPARPGSTTTSGV